MRSVLSLFATLVVSVPVVLALQEQPATVPCIPGAACTYTYTSSAVGNPLVTVNGFCAPDGFCGDNGAACASSASCYNTCGSNNICGGLGATCNSQLPTGNGQLVETCFTPSFTCTTTSGVSGSCIAAAVPSNPTRSRRRQQLTLHRCSEDLTACPTNNFYGAAMECIDTQNSLEQCGGCNSASGGTDCSELSNVADVECQKGACVVKSCLPGFLHLRNRCI